MVGAESQVRLACCDQPRARVINPSAGSLHLNQELIERLCDDSADDLRRICEVGVDRRSGDSIAGASQFVSSTASLLSESGVAGAAIRTDK